MGIEKVKGEFGLSFYRYLSESLKRKSSELYNDDLLSVKSYVGYFREFKNKLPYYLYRVSMFGVIHPTIFKSLTTILFNMSWVGDKEIRMEDLHDSKFVKDFLSVYDLKSQNFFNVIDYRRAAATPLAYRVLCSIINRYRGLSEYGMIDSRVIVSGTLGSGKTTFVFYSVYSDLRLLKFTHDEAMMIIDSLFVNDLENLMLLFKIANRLIKDGLFLPFIIVDDAAVILSKYEISPSTSTSTRIKKFLVDFSKFYQLSREGIGTIVTISCSFH